MAFDPLPEFTESGHISARHLDDKAGVAALLAALKAIVDSGAEPQIDCHPLFTITEETGTGAAGTCERRGRTRPARRTRRTRRACAGRGRGMDL